jgi:hypothetical protein
MPFLPFTAFFFYWNVSADGINDCKGFLVLWRCFCDLIRLFNCFDGGGVSPLLQFIVVTLLIRRFFHTQP